MKRTVAAVFALLLLAGLCPALADGIRLEEDAFFTYGDIGGYPIDDIECSGAENGMAIDGVDLNGEWIAWRLDLSTSLCFVDSLRSAGKTRQTRTFSIEFLPEPPTTTSAADTVTTVEGSGVG